MKRSLLVLSVFALMVWLPASAASIDVFVGYSDNLRASGFFPTPWIGSPGVVTQTPGGESLDSDAIRIDNSSSNPITISDLTVTFGGGQTVNIWSPLTIPAGGKGIFTQTVSYNFDSSDFGVFGTPPVNVDATHPLGGCTNPANPTQVAQCLAFQPVISFKVDGAAVTPLRDTGHILDTFGYDLLYLPPPGGDGNESINWNAIGSVPSREGNGGSTAPEPSTVLLIAPALTGALLLRRGSRRARLRRIAVRIP
jgi:hypothetical protein